jgi:amidase
MLAYTPPQIGTFLALEHEENFMEQTRWSPWGSLFNVAQLPAISIPWTLTAGAGVGLSAQTAQTPVGVQVGSVTLDDAQLLHLASVLHV